MNDQSRGNWYHDRHKKDCKLRGGGEKEEKIVQEMTDYGVRTQVWVGGVAQVGYVWGMRYGISIPPLRVGERKRKGLGVAYQQTKNRSV